MRKDNNTTSENQNNITSSENIPQTNASTPNKLDDAMKRLDAMFEAEEEDLAWLDNIMNNSAETKKSENEEQPDLNNFENDLEEEPEAEELTDEKEDSIRAENADNGDSPQNGNDFFDETDDSDTKIYSGTSDNNDNAPEVDLDFFENETPNQPEKPEFISGADSAVPQENKVNNSLGKLFGFEVFENDDSNEKKKFKKKKSEHKKIAKELGAYEEINMADATAVSQGQRKYYLSKCKALTALVGATFFLLVSLYFELSMSGKLPFPAAIGAQNAPKVFALLDLQIMCFSAMCLLDSLTKGFFAILDKRFSPSSCALVISSVCALQAIVSVFVSGNGTTIKMFCCVGCLALFMLAFYDYLKASADDKSFRIASSTSNKYGAYELGVDSLECSPFASHIDLEKAKVISVCKGSVYDGFVGRNERRPEGEKKLGRLTGIISAIALLIGIFVALAMGNVYTGINAMTVVIISSLPINIFFVSALPKYLASRYGKSIGAALVGQNASEEYKGLSVVAFEDTEVFLPKDVRISSIKTYGGMALDEAVVTMSKIYEKIGGPLSKIFAKMVENQNRDSDVRLVKVYPDAIEVIVDSKEFCLATASYLGTNGIRIISDSVDNAFEQSHGSILFMVCGGRILAKFYIKYSINPLFERTLKELHDANLCVGIKTLDPCINNDLIFSCLEKANYALSVIKGNNANDIPTVKQKVSSGIVALGNVHNFLEMLLMCERTGRNVKINCAIKLISAFLSVIISAIFVLTNNSLNVIFCLIIQLFWLIPVIAISYFNK